MQSPPTLWSLPQTSPTDAKFIKMRDRPDDEGESKGARTFVGIIEEERRFLMTEGLNNSETLYTFSPGEFSRNFKNPTESSWSWLHRILKNPQNPQESSRILKNPQESSRSPKGQNTLMLILSFFLTYYFLERNGIHTYTFKSKQGNLLLLLLTIVDW